MITPGVSGGIVVNHPRLYPGGEGGDLLKFLRTVANNTVRFVLGTCLGVGWPRLLARLGAEARSVV